MLKEIRKGEKGALARAITEIERGTSQGQEILSQLDKGFLNAYVIGITGPSGAGKSTLLNALANEYVASGEKVAILAVDPTSPFSGGALLGDRLRMNSLALNPSVFIRSIGSRGRQGGICPMASDIIRVMDAAGYPLIFVETVGIGQAEVEVMDIADTVVLVITPDYGDGIQTLKAGVMEIADIFVINKADKYDASAFASELRTILEMSRNNSNPWQKPVIVASARRKEGINELKDAIEAHKKFLTETKLLEKQRFQRRLKEFAGSLASAISQNIKEMISGGEFKDLEKLIAEGASSLHIKKQLVKKLLEDPDAIEKVFG